MARGDMMLDESPGRGGGRALGGTARAPAELRQGDGRLSKTYNDPLRSVQIKSRKLSTGAAFCVQRHSVVIRSIIIIICAQFTNIHKQVNLG